MQQHTAVIRRSVGKVPVDDPYRLEATEALSELDLAQASRAVADGRVVNASTGEPIAWEGYPIVMPVTDRLRDHVFGDDYQARVADELERLDLRLAPRGSG